MAKAGIGNILQNLEGVGANALFNRTGTQGGGLSSLIGGPMSGIGMLTGGGGGGDVLSKALQMNPLYRLFMVLSGQAHNTHSGPGPAPSQDTGLSVPGTDAGIGYG